MPDELKNSFLGSLHASPSVLLVIPYGVIASQFNILKRSTTKQISTLCMRMLPPAIVTNVGCQLHVDTGIRYMQILSKSSSTSQNVLLIKIFKQYGASSMH